MKDNFSAQSALYAQYRPTYPLALFEHILPFVNERNIAWDCATGNGQAAGALSNYFTKVYATDISDNQLKKAVKKENIVYSKQPAEKTKFEDNTFDLVTVAQAIHWFDFEAFYTEVKRVCKNDSVIAVIGYGLVRTTGETQKFLSHFYHDIVGPYWDAERKYIDENYQTIPFPFEELPSIPLQILYSWNIDTFTGYLHTWSAVQHYIKAHQENPVDLFRNDLRKAWGKTSTQTFTFPVLMRIGRIEK